jgi:hypothetical protein
VPIGVQLGLFVLTAVAALGAAILGRALARGGLDFTPAEARYLLSLWIPGIIFLAAYVWLTTVVGSMPPLLMTLVAGAAVSAVLSVVTGSRESRLNPANQRRMVLVLRALSVFQASAAIAVGLAILSATGQL